MRWRCHLVAALGAIASSALAVEGVAAQGISVGDPLEDYLRVLQITGRPVAGSFTVRSLVPTSASAVLDGPAHPWASHLGESSADAVELTDPRLRFFANSRFPSGRNDGAIWQGRGLTTAADVGVRARWRNLTVIVQPTVIVTQNARFELAPVVVPQLPEQAYPWRRIDMPQRFGSDSFWTLDPGQSAIRLGLGGVIAGASTGNLWWGPGIRNAIVMSSNAPGFPHGFVATNGPIESRIGAFEVSWIWGRLAQSDWFDPEVELTDRFITGMALTYSPSFLDGLSVGLTRVFYVLVPESGIPFGDYLAVFRGVRKKSFVTPYNPTGDDEHDQLLSLFGRWVLRESGFEVYWEWARNDHSWELRDFLLEPEHSQAYTLGLSKALSLRGDADRLLSLTLELTHLEADATLQVRGRGTYYEHSVVTQGYTHKGQIIGAGIGPGGNSQYLGADLYDSWGRAGVYLERQVHDNDAYYDWALANGETFCCHDVSFNVGMHGLVFVDDLDLGAGMIITREYNRYFYGLDLWNLNLSLSARWRRR